MARGAGNVYRFVLRVIAGQLETFILVKLEQSKQVRVRRIRETKHRIQSSTVASIQITKT